MEDRLYYHELECYRDADDALLRECGNADYLDLSLLPTETMREEVRRYFRDRGTHVTLRTVTREKAHYKLFCQALQGRRKLPDSLLGWEESKWVQILKGYMLQNGISLTRESVSVYGTVHTVQARQIMFVRRLIQFLQPEDERQEQEKDIWHLDKLDIEIKQNPIYRTNTLNFTGICQTGIREEVKQAIYTHLKYENLGTVKREMSSLRMFSKYLEEQQKGITSCKEIDRTLVEEYLTYIATSGGSGKSNSDNIIKLRSVLETVGKLFEWPHLEKLLINTDIQQEVQPEFKVYSDNELKRLNEQITKLDEQITRCMVIHQMLGTRISDTLTLQRDCLSQSNGMDMIKIRQVKSTVYEKPISAELAALIRKAVQYSKERYGDAVYIFVDEKDTSRPLQYTTIKHKVLALIQRENLRDDEGKHFRFPSHMFRRTYGAKLTELHLDDWTISKLLGHRGVHTVVHYRKMNNLILAAETRRAREEQTRILLENLDGWEDEYEHIRQDD